MQFADHSKLKKEGRNFDCSSCPLRVQKLRRCHEDRWDFTEEDASFFPMSVSKGGTLFGFCPGKATWDNEAMTLFNTLVTCVEYDKLLTNKSVLDHSTWAIDLLAWFAVEYKQEVFISRAKMIFGDGTSKKGVKKSGR